MRVGTAWHLAAIEPPLLEAHGSGTALGGESLTSACLEPAQSSLMSAQLRSSRSPLTRAPSRNCTHCRSNRDFSRSRRKAKCESVVCWRAQGLRWTHAAGFWHGSTHQIHSISCPPTIGAECTAANAAREHSRTQSLPSHLGVRHLHGLRCS